MNNTFLKRLLFFWIASFTCAILGYYLLKFIMPNDYVFGMYYRMLLYHYEYPIGYILIPCIIYGLLCMYFMNRLQTGNSWMRLFFVGIIVFLTVLISSPLGGMLWQYHDMNAGYFPDDWLLKMIIKGSIMGFQFGWLIIALSIPYNILGIIISYFITSKGINIKYKVI